LEFKKKTEKPWKQILITAAGVGANIILLLCIGVNQSMEMIGKYVYSLTHFELIKVSGTLQEYCILVSFILITINIIPTKNSDGKKIKELLTNR